MIIGVPREVTTGERRIGLIAESARRLCERGLEVLVEAAPSGDPGLFTDQGYVDAGARVLRDRAELFQAADVVVKVHPPRAGRQEVQLLRRGSALVGILQPYQNTDVVQQLAARHITAFSLDLLPRTTRAQTMDVLSSQSTVAGYKAALLAANELPKLMPMMMTAAGTLRPARVLILGAGVAGLQAIATARRLGAIVEAFDVRLAVKEQVESLGARFIGEDTVLPDAEDSGGYAREVAADQLALQRQVLERHMAAADVIICSALVPGKKAPVLITREQVEGLRPGSLVIDMAAEQGGNCQLSEAGETVEHAGVRIFGPRNLPSSLPVHASQMLSRNIENFVTHVAPEGELKLDLEDEIIRSTLVTFQGEVADERVRSALET